MCDECPAARCLALQPLFTGGHIVKCDSQGNSRVHAQENKHIANLVVAERLDGTVVQTPGYPAVNSVTVTRDLVDQLFARIREGRRPIAGQSLRLSQTPIRGLR
jgi:hypothetical protein